MRWVRHVALKGDVRNATEFWSESVKGRDHSEVLDADWRITLIQRTHEFFRSKYGYSGYGTERKKSHLLCVEDLKLIARSEEELRNEIRIVKIRHKKVDFRLEKRATLESVSVHIGNKMGNGIKELVDESLRVCIQNFPD
jgi:hypothetical protein